MLVTARERTVIITSANAELRSKLAEALRGMRWAVRTACGGAEALGLLEEHAAEGMIVDSWLPDLDIAAFTGYVLQQVPQLDLLTISGTPVDGARFRSVRRHELLQAIREATQQPENSNQNGKQALDNPTKALPETQKATPVQARIATSPVQQKREAEGIPGLVGAGPAMRELARLIRLVAPHDASVLIEGETGSGKELVAKAVHSLSARSSKPLVTLNCAAIPEALLEAELFGHTRGAFTGAAQARTGRIEAAHGGTLFLDEIGEMPISLQAKLLRFLENGELQRIGENQPVRVDVRVISATHRNLEQQISAGGFRLDLFHRLAVFPLEVPSLRERREDLPSLCNHLLVQLAGATVPKHLNSEALDALLAHHWSGNVRELGHVLHRAVILSENRPEITKEEIRIRRTERK